MIPARPESSKEYPAGQPRVYSGAYSVLRRTNVGKQVVSPVARAWAVARLRRCGEVVTEDAIQRVIEGKPLQFASAGHSPIPVREEEAEPANKGGQAEMPDAAMDHRPPADPREVETTEQPAIETELPEGRKQNSDVEQSPTSQSMESSSVGFREDQNRESISDLHQELSRHRKALEESRRREVALQRSLDELSQRVRDADSFESEIQTLTAQLEHSQGRIHELSNRMDEAKVEEMLRQAEQTHLHEQRQLYRESEQRERELRESLDAAQARIKNLEKEKAQISQEVAAKDRETLDLQDQLNTKDQEIQELQSLLEEVREEQAETRRLLEERDAPADEEATRLRAELEALQQKAADFSGFDHPPSLESRRLLVETLEGEVMRLGRRQEELSNRLQNLDANEDSLTPSRLKQETELCESMLETISQRMESLNSLIHESLVYLRKRQGSSDPPSGDASNSPPTA